MNIHGAHFSSPTPPRLLEAENYVCMWPGLKGLCEFFFHIPTLERFFCRVHSQKTLQKFPARAQIFLHLMNLKRCLPHPPIPLEAINSNRGLRERKISISIESFTPPKTTWPPRPPPPGMDRTIPSAGQESAWVLKGILNTNRYVWKELPGRRNKMREGIFKRGSRHDYVSCVQLCSEKAPGRAILDVSVKHFHARLLVCGNAFEFPYWTPR